MARLPGAPEASSLLEATIAGFDTEYGLTRLDTRAGPLQVARAGLVAGHRLRVRILASDVLVSLTPLDGISALNVLSGTIAEIGERNGGGAIDLRIDCSGEIVVARLTAKSVAALALAPGRPVYAVIKSVSIDAP